MKNKFLSLFLALIISIFPVTAMAAQGNFQIVNQDKDNKPVLGFTYELINSKTNEKIKDIDLTKESTFEMNLEEGSYKLVETKRPDKYDKAKDYEFVISAKEGKASLKYVPKHIEKKIVSKTKKEGNKFAPTNVAMSSVPLALVIGAMIGCVTTLNLNKKEQY